MSEAKREVTAILSRTVQFGEGDDKEFVKVGFIVTETIPKKEELEDAMDRLYGMIDKKIEEKLGDDEYDPDAEDGTDEGGDADGGDDDGWDEGDEGGGDDAGGGDDDGGDDDGWGDDDGCDDDGLTPEAIREMGKKELIELIKSEELDIKPKDVKGIEEMREKVIDALFEPEDSGDEGADDDDWGDDDWGDDED